MDQFDEMVLRKIVRETPVSEVLRRSSAIYTQKAHGPGRVEPDQKAMAIYMIIDRAVEEIEKGPSKWK